MVYVRDVTVRLPTRTRGEWYIFHTIQHDVDAATFPYCTIDRRTNTHIMMTGFTNDQTPAGQHPFSIDEIQTERSYRVLTIYSDNNDDNGYTLFQQM